MSEPAPKPTSERPVWEMVIEDALERWYGTTDEADVLSVSLPGDALHSDVIRDMRARHEIGIARYGTPLQASNGRNHLQDAYDEALDRVAYLRAAIETRSPRARYI